jgi:hypothetical protein
MGKPPACKARTAQIASKLAAAAAQIRPASLTRVMLHRQSTTACKACVTGQLRKAAHELHAAKELGRKAQRASVEEEQRGVSSRRCLAEKQTHAKTDGQADRWASMDRHNSRQTDRDCVLLHSACIDAGHNGGERGQRKGCIEWTARRWRLLESLPTQDLVDVGAWLPDGSARGLCDYHGAPSAHLPEEDERRRQQDLTLRQRRPKRRRLRNDQRPRAPVPAGACHIGPECPQIGTSGRERQIGTPVPAGARHISNPLPVFGALMCCL